MAKHKKLKIVSQRQVYSRMNFLYQAATMMAHNDNKTLAAYYGKLCRNLGTKAVLHIAPSVKRTFCKRCSLPLLPGVNTTLQLSTPKQPESQPTGTTKKKRSGKQRHRRLRLKRDKNEQAAASMNFTATNARQSPNMQNTNDDVTLQLQCSLCQAQRCFRSDTQNECWLEQPDAVLHTISLQQQSNGERAGSIKKIACLLHTT